MKRQLFFLVIVAVLLALSACTASQVAEPVGQIEQAGATSTSLPTNPPPTATLVPTAFPTPAPRLDELVMAAMGGWNSDEIGADQIDLTISYFADAAVFEMIGFPPDMPSRFVGREAIRAAYESWLPLHPKLEVIIEATEEDTVTATTSYWSDPLRAMHVAPLVGTDVYVFEDGMIVSETWTLNEESQSSFAGAMATAAAPTPSPEAPAASLDDLVGLWSGYWSDQTPLYFEIEEDGAFTVSLPEGERIIWGTVTFEDGKLVFTSSHGNVATRCAENPRAEYLVYVTKQGDQSIKLRFELASEEEQCVDRQMFLDGRELKPVNP